MSMNARSQQLWTGHRGAGSTGVINKDLQVIKNELGAAFRCRQLETLGFDRT